MTESEWLTWADPEWMLKFIQAQASERKLRLFAVTCSRRIWHLLDDDRSRRAIEVAEAFADGRCSEYEMQTAHIAADMLSNSIRGRTAAEVAIRRTPRKTRENTIDLGFPRDYSFMSFAEVVLECVRHELREEGFYSDDDLADEYRKEEAWCHLLRDIFANPFRPVTLDPQWRTSTVVALAQQMYESRDFSAMPILADALEDAGCDNDDILTHCRDANQVHVRGCWVVDMILGKE